MRILIGIYKINLKAIYFILKLLPLNKKKVVFLSRQSDKPSLDFLLLQKQIKEKCPDAEMVFLTKKFEKSFIKLIEYYFHTLKQMYHIATAKVCVLDSYIIPISILKHRKSLKVMQIWHAIGAIKKFGYQTLLKEYGRDLKLSKSMNMHSNYDTIISGSEAMVPFFCEAFNADREVFINCGLPKIDYLIQNKEKIKEELRNKYPIFNNKKVILYAPTFRVYKVDAAYNLCEYINYDKYVFITKHHPNDNNYNTDDRVSCFDEISTLDLLAAADIVITDYSAVSLEAAAINKPIYFYMHDYADYEKNNGLNINLFNEFPGCAFESPQDLIKAIEEDNYDMTLVEKFKRKYVANDGNSSEQITDIILSNIYEKKKVGAYETV